MTELVEPFIASLINIFDTMFGCAVAQNGATRDRQMHSTRDVTGIIGLSGNADGNIVLSMDREVALSLTEAMLGQRPESIDEDVIDAVGETVNIVAGQAKAQLASLELSLGTPTVVTGREQTIRFTRQNTPVWLSFTSPWGGIDLCVGLSIALIPTGAV